MLWGRAAGICSNPTCKRDLTRLVKPGGAYVVGEMAHVIARSPTGPRGKAGGGSNSYDNLILLCPTCHTDIDKSPVGTYSEEMLFTWKSGHEAAIRRIGSDNVHASRESLNVEIRRLLRENFRLWQECGPQSPTAISNPDSSLHRIWNLRKLDTIVPNNQRIINVIGANQCWLTDDEWEICLRYKAHALAFEQHQYGRLEDYPLFPTAFGDLFEK